MYKGLYYIYIVAKNTVVEKRKMIFQMINHTVFLLFTIYLYGYVYTLLPSVSDRLPYTNAIWSMSMYFVAFWLGLRNIEKVFRQDILSGNIEMYLLRPISYIWQKVFVQIGQGLLSFTMALFLSIIVSYFFIGLPQTNMNPFTWALALGVIFFLSQVLTCLLYTICGLTGFWLQNSEPVYLGVSKLIMILGGAWVPAAFFPHWLELIATYSPFGASVALSFAMYPNFGERFIPLTLNAIIWIGISLLIVNLMSKRAMRKLSVNG